MEATRAPFGKELEVNNTFIKSLKRPLQAF